MATTEQLRQELTDLETRAYALDLQLQRIAAGLSIPTTEATMPTTNLDQVILDTARRYGISPGTLPKATYTMLVDEIYPTVIGVYTRAQIMDRLAVLGYKQAKASMVPILVAGTIVYFLSK